MKTSPWYTVLAGKHPYNLSPEEETLISRDCLCVGIFIGFFFGALLGGMIERCNSLPRGDRTSSYPMIPRYTDEPMVRFETLDETRVVKLELFDDEHREQAVGGVSHYEDVWWCELYQPNGHYRTGWAGPFDTKSEAKEYIREVWEVDPRTGDPLTYEG